jgi:cytochrome c oxidase subunit 1
MANETRGKIHFWASMIFFNITFFPMHFLGLAGMPRRYADYPTQFADFNLIASIGALGFGLSQAYFLFFVALPAYRGQGQEAPAKPWDGAKGFRVDSAFTSPTSHFRNSSKCGAVA